MSGSLHWGNLATNWPYKQIAERILAGFPTGLFLSIVFALHPSCNSNLENERRNYQPVTSAGTEAGAFKYVYPFFYAYVTCAGEAGGSQG